MTTFWAKIDPTAPTTQWDMLVLQQGTVWDENATIWDLELVTQDNWTKVYE